MMKSGTSNLNPNALSYVPLAKRKANVENQDYKSMLESVASSDVYGSQKLPVADGSKLKGQETALPGGSSSQNPHGMADKGPINEQLEINLSFLQMMFPKFSYESLLGAYNSCMGDVDAAYDMLSDLESDDPTVSLPDALDIGDVPLPASSGNSSSIRVKQVVGESSKWSDSVNAAPPT